MAYSHLQGLNVGSGQHYAEGWLNVDAIPTDKGKQPDMLLQIEDFHKTFQEKVFKKVYVGHVLEHIRWSDLSYIIDNLAYVGEKVMVVGPCIDKAIATDQPISLIDGIRAPEDIDFHPWSHKWTPTEELTIQAIREAGYEPNVVDIKTVRKPEWPNPSIACWQTAMWFSSQPIDS